MTMVTDRTRQRPVKKATYPRSCLVCAMRYNYTPAGKDKGHEHKRGLFCSWACKSKHIKDSKPGPHSKLYVGECATCKTPVVSRTRSKYCSDGCKPKVVYQGPTTMLMTQIRSCNVCFRQFDYVRSMGRPPEQCSDECKHVLVSAQRRVGKAKRKAVLKKAKIESVDPFKVFDRDGWKCKMCGIDTPRDKRGTWDNNAPELDHVVPLSKGGEHSYANTQCSCRKCNIRKSDNILPNISAAQTLISVAKGHNESLAMCAP